jgi:hypothetical protein
VPPQGCTGGEWALQGGISQHRAGHLAGGECRLRFFVLKKEELEKKLKHNVVLYTKFLVSSSIILDMLLDAPLRLGGVLADLEELILRDVLGEMAVVGVPNSGVFEEDVAAASVDLEEVDLGT